jgi:hypothetical protein
MDLGLMGARILIVHDEEIVIKSWLAAAMGTDLNDFNGRPQTSNLRVGSSNLSGRASEIKSL